MSTRVTPAGKPGVVAVGEGVGVTVCVGLGVAVCVGDGVAVCVGVGVAVTVTVAVGDCVGACVTRQTVTPCGSVVSQLTVPDRLVGVEHPARTSTAASSPARRLIMQPPS